MKRSAFFVPALILSLAPAVSQAHAQAPLAHVAAATGTLSGVITDAVTNKPLAGVLLTVGYLTKGYQRAAMTDAHGRYTITGLPPTRGIDAYAFKAGYFYFHGESAIRAGGVTTYSHVMPRDVQQSVPHPRIVSYYATSGARSAHFGMRADKGNGPFSFEMMAISPDLGRLVVLQHGPSNHYDGTLPTVGIKRGTYTFYFVATQENCFENKPFPSMRVHLG